jgi:hypothetical protein
MRVKNDHFPLFLLIHRGVCSEKVRWPQGNHPPDRDFGV